MTTDTWLLDIAVREVIRRNPGYVHPMRHKARRPDDIIFGWDHVEARIRRRYASLWVAEQDFWASVTVAEAEDAGRRLESLGHPGFLIGSAA